MIPQEYVGREQTWLKHRVLEEYLVAWAHKLGSGGRKTRVKLWYVDCFSGPWKARTAELTDTSIMIGLRALQSARETWAARGIKIDLGAVFIEKDESAYRELERVVAQHARGLDAHPFHGKFGDHLPQIESLIRNSSAFLLVDPTGWDGAAMKFIAPLVRQKRRDVMVNVMFDHINRFKDDPREFLRAQMKAFFGLSDDDLQAGLSEEDLMDLYRQRLRTVCDVPFTADLAVPHPTIERTKFRLVVGGHHPEVLRLFRDVERKVMGEEAAVVRTQAKERERFDREGQLAMFAPEPPKESPRYAAQRDEGRNRARARVPELLRDQGRLRYDALWPIVLAECHVTEGDLAGIISDLRVDGLIRVDGMKARERRIKDDHLVSLAR
jgi:three-Cys-motif partner protein